MAPRKQRGSTPEFPILEANGLYAGDIRGDGNCLFNALSDQLFGHQDMHEVLRIATIEHMRQHSAFYRQYMAVNNVRRNPKRKATAALPTRIDTTPHTEEELQTLFEEHVEKMGQPGEWADNMEVSAFASALNVHVRLWQADYTYLFSPRDYYFSEDGLDAIDERPVVHIAYHNWEHYSSVRNMAGPHHGPPQVTVIPQQTSLKKRPSPSISGDDEDDIPRARKRRSPLPLFDSDSTPEGTESSSDESNGPISSQSSHLNIPDAETKPQKLTIKLRGLRTTDPSEPLTAIPPSLPPSLVTPPSSTTTDVTSDMVASAGATTGTAAPTAPCHEGYATSTS